MPAVLVEREHRVHVHHVDVVAAEHADLRRLLVEDEVEVLVDGIGGAAEPVRPSPHLGGDRVDELADLGVQAPGPHEVLDERVRLELREHLDLHQPRVDEVVEDEVDDPVTPPERDRRLGTVPRERVEALSHSAGQDDREDVAVLKNLHGRSRFLPF